MKCIPIQRHQIVLKTLSKIHHQRFSLDHQMVHQTILRHKKLNLNTVIIVDLSVILRKSVYGLKGNQKGRLKIFPLLPPQKQYQLCLILNLNQIPTQNLYLPHFAIQNKILVLFYFQLILMSIHFLLSLSPVILLIMFRLLQLDVLILF